MSRKLHLDVYKEGLLAGNIAILSRAITLIESRRTEDKLLATRLIDEILPYTGNAIRVGITGVPGVGKSTFIEALGLHLLEKGKRVAVLAVDPSSSISKGSILGDKTRMEFLSAHPKAFIRPSASSGSLGGVAYKTYEAMLLCEAAGFDTVFIETVGVGQSETEVRQICDFFLLLMLAGAGDELQGIKRGIMELADAIAITKAEEGNMPAARRARAEYARALHFIPPAVSGWIPEVLTCSAYTKEGIDAVWSVIEKYTLHTRTGGYFDANRKKQVLAAFRRLLNEQLYMSLLSRSGIQEEILRLEREVEGAGISPYSAVQKILKMVEE